MAQYRCWDDNMEPDEAWLTDARSFREAAEQFSEYSFYERDGWEWLRDGQIFNIADEHETRRMEITVETVPRFHAQEATE